MAPQTRDRLYDSPGEGRRQATLVEIVDGDAVVCLIGTNEWRLYPVAIFKEHCYEVGDDFWIG